MITHVANYPPISQSRVNENILITSVTDGLNDDSFSPQYTITTTLSFGDAGIATLLQDLKVAVGKYSISFSTSPVNDWDINITGVTTFAQLNTVLLQYDYSLFPDYTPAFTLDFEETSPGLYRPRITTFPSSLTSPYVVEDYFNFITENYGATIYTKPVNQPINLRHIIETNGLFQQSVAVKTDANTMTSSFELNDIVNTFLPKRNGRVFIEEALNQELPTTINFKYYSQDQFGREQHGQDTIFLIDSARGGEVEINKSLSVSGWLNPSALVRSNNVLAVAQEFGLSDYVPSSVDPQTYNYQLLHDDDKVFILSFTNWIPFDAQGGDGTCTLRSVFLLDDGSTQIVNISYPSNLSVFHINVSALNGYGVGFTPPSGTRVLQGIYQLVYGVSDTSFSQPYFVWYTPVPTCDSDIYFVYKNIYGGLSTARMSMENTRLTDTSPSLTVVNTLRTNTLVQFNNGGSDTIMSFVAVTSDYAEYQELEQMAYTDRIALVDVQVLPTQAINNLNLSSNVLATKIETNWQDNVGTVRLECKMLNRGI
jgi:hypothetical protein